MSIDPSGKTVADVQAIVDRSAFLSWLGIKVIALESDTIEVRATWRSEWVANPVVGQTQGGILSALIDFAACFSLMSKIGRPAFTVDLRTDYHRASKNSDLVAKGSVIKFGKQVATCEAELFDLEGRLIASGRGTFLTASSS
ncbi:PaaI family thioesterase [Undibacter mobilis]|uniref:PaaI family thioesterase n=1 Tax=Undibacter mobilis TaxID=2292256 RepID=A0A371B380_9BRAD|nr:PaaI family thioesterase [Undibacter mobilis]RDV02045.1 PaaI family thioesterase [Undibacter mobilis]